MKLQYQAKQRNGTAASGVLEAASITEARQRLRTQGLFVTSLTIDKAEAGGIRQARRLFSGVRKADLVLVVSQLTIMCQSGVDLAEALGNLVQQCTKPALRSVLEKVHQDVSGGSSFSESLRKHPRVFDETFVAGIAAGEQTGSLTGVLERLAVLMRGDLRLRSTIWSMLMYPIVLATITFLVLNALIFFVLPQFATVFKDLEKPVPPLTRLLLDFGAFVRGHVLLVAGGFAGCVGGLIAMRNTEFVRRRRDHALVHLALVRTASRSLLAGRAFRLLGTMLMSGVPLVEGIRLCRNAAKNRLFRQLFDEIEQEVLHGEGMKKPLLAAAFLPAGAAQMVVTAERSGRMGEVLKNIGEYFEEEGERSLRNLIKLAEPAVIVFLGLVVAGIVLSIMIPLLDVTTASH